jgi:large subunit ribosomal protein L13
MNNKTYQPKAKDVKRGWHLIDAKDAILGRLSTNAAKLLMGKHKTKYAPHLDMGDFVVVKNAEKIKLSGRKMQNKVYYTHSGYPGGLKEIKVSKLFDSHPERVVEWAIKGMLPDNRLKDKRLRRLKVVVGDRNPFGDKFK